MDRREFLTTVALAAVATVPVLGSANEVHALILDNPARLVLSSQGYSPNNKDLFEKNIISAHQDFSWAVRRGRRTLLVEDTVGDIYIACDKTPLTESRSDIKSLWVEWFDADQGVSFCTMYTPGKPKSPQGPLCGFSCRGKHRVAILKVP